MRRIVFLTGAGFTAGEEFAGITTGQLTSIVRDDSKFVVNDTTFGNFIYETIYNYYNIQTNFPEFVLPIEKNINFEVMLHFIEKVYSQLHSLYTNNRPDWRSLEPSFSIIHPFFFSKILEFHYNYFKKGFGLQYDVILELAYYNYIDRICIEISKFNLDKSNIGMNRFMSFIDQYFDNKNFIKRFYTLNYDDWIPRNYNYFDGFGEDKRFAEHGLSQRREVNIQYNLHGSIWWDIELGRSNIKKLDSPYKKIGSSSHEVSMSRDPILKSPIITGLNKHTLASYNPFNFFFKELILDLEKADCLIIIGYSFGDENINNFLKLYQGKILIIDFDLYFDETYTLYEKGFKNQRSDKRSNLARLCYTIPAINNDYFPSRQGKFDDSITGLTSSELNTMQLWLRGLGDHFYRNAERILGKVGLP